MDATELKQAMRDCGLNSSDMSRVVGLSKTTFQRYVDGTAKVPTKVARKILAHLEYDRQVMAGILGKIDADIASRFPYGIKSQAEPGEV